MPQRLSIARLRRTSPSDEVGALLRSGGRRSRTWWALQALPDPHGFLDGRGGLLGHLRGCGGATAEERVVGDIVVVKWWWASPVPRRAAHRRGLRCTTSLPGTSGRHAGIGSRELTRRVSHIPKQSSRFPWRRIRCELSRHHRTFQQVATGAYFVVANAPANSVVRSAASARRRAWHQRTRRFSEGLWHRGCRRRSGPRMP